MGTIVTTFTFDTGNDGFTLSGIISRITSGGLGDTACLHGIVSGRNTGGPRNGSAIWSGNFEDLGVPAGATVTGVSFTLHRAVTQWNTVNYADWVFETDIAGTLIEHAEVNETGLAGWDATVDNDVTGLDLASDSAISIEMVCSLRTANNQQAVVEVRWDDITVTVDYDEPGAAVVDGPMTGSGLGTSTVKAKLQVSSSLQGSGEGSGKFEASSHTPVVDVVQSSLRGSGSGDAKLSGHAVVLAMMYGSGVGGTYPNFRVQIMVRIKGEGQGQGSLQGEAIYLGTTEQGSVAGSGEGFGSLGGRTIAKTTLKGSGTSRGEVQGKAIVKVSLDGSGQAGASLKASVIYPGMVIQVSVRGHGEGQGSLSGTSTISGRFEGRGEGSGTLYQEPQIPTQQGSFVGQGAGSGDMSGKVIQKAALIGKGQGDGAIYGLVIRTASLFGKGLGGGGLQSNLIILGEISGSGESGGRLFVADPIPYTSVLIEEFPETLSVMEDMESLDIRVLPDAAIIVGGVSVRKFHKGSRRTIGISLKNTVPGDLVIDSAAYEVQNHEGDTVQDGTADFDVQDVKVWALMDTTLAGYVSDREENKNRYTCWFTIDMQGMDKRIVYPVIFRVLPGPQ